jgi:putative membrane-bound dehydrogenase-like protein
MICFRSLALAGTVFLWVSRFLNAAEVPAAAAPLVRSSPAIATNIIGSFQLKPGFKIELVAMEPQVESPVAMAFDENGRLFVAEMRDFPDRREQTPHLGKIRLLEDTDGDGVFDASTVYADNLPWPSAIACYWKGIFVGATPDIFYLKDTNGDGIAETRKLVFSGFGGDLKNLKPDSLLNNFTWSLDNRIHGGASGIGGVINAINAASTPPLQLGRSDFSFDPVGFRISAEFGSAQSGLSFDNYGRKLQLDFAHLVRSPAYEGRYFVRNPFFPRPPDLIDVSGPAISVFRYDLTAHPPVGTAAVKPVPMTRPQGCVIYRGSAFPSNYVDNLFLADAAAGIIHREILRENGPGLVSSPAPEEQNTEFLVSKDPAFQPIQMINGPDGALYVADFHGGAGKGRIFRIVPTRFQQPTIPQLADAKTYDLVALLANANGWHRDTAARLLFEEHDPAANMLLTNMVQNSRLPLARFTALRVLAGRGALTEATVVKNLRDPDEHVRSDAVELCEQLINNGNVSDLVWNQLKPLAADPSLRVRYQFAFTVGYIHRPEKASLLAQVLRRDLANPWLASAVLSSLSDSAGDLFVRLAGDPAFRNDTAGQAFLLRLITMMGVRGQLDDATRVMDFVDRTSLDVRQAYEYLFALGEGLHHTRSSISLIDKQSRLKRFFDNALLLAVDDSQPEALRIDSIKLLGVGPYTYGDIADILLLLFGSNQSQAIQSTALNTFGLFTDATIATNLFARWQVLSPISRKQTLNSVLKKYGGAAQVLAALESGQIQAGDMSSVQADYLRTYGDPAVSQWATRLLGPPVKARPAVMDQFKSALKAAGNAQRGREIFNARCATCHRLGGKGLVAGPDFDEIRLRGKDKLLSAILEPNLEIRSEFMTYTLDTNEAETWIGTVTDQNQTSVTLLLPDGQQSVWPRSNIEKLTPQSWSTMPDGLEQGLSPQGMADLLEYIMTTPR